MASLCFLASSHWTLCLKCAKSSEQSISLTMVSYVFKLSSSDSSSCGEDERGVGSSVPNVVVKFVSWGVESETVEAVGENGNADEAAVEPRLLLRVEQSLILFGASAV